MNTLKIICVWVLLLAATSIGQGATRSFGPVYEWHQGTLAHWYRIETDERIISIRADASKMKQYDFGCAESYKMCMGKAHEGDCGPGICDAEECVVSATVHISAEEADKFFNATLATAKLGISAQLSGLGRKLGGQFDWESSANVQWSGETAIVPGNDRTYPPVHAQACERWRLPIRATFRAEGTLQLDCLKMSYYSVTDGVTWHREPLRVDHGVEYRYPNCTANVDVHLTPEPDFAHIVRERDCKCLDKRTPPEVPPPNVPPVQEELAPPTDDTGPSLDRAPHIRHDWSEEFPLPPETPGSAPREEPPQRGRGGCKSPWRRHSRWPWDWPHRPTREDAPREGNDGEEPHDGAGQTGGRK